jgi:NAD binding domain of 6-phosphogluconate dehydrogenase
MSTEEANLARPSGQEAAAPASRRVAAPTDIGFVGLGQMWTAMAANLAAAGHRVIAYVRRPDHMDDLSARGLKPTTHVADLFDCAFVISMVPDDNAVREVVFGRQDRGINGLASGLKRGAIHLCMTATDHSLAARNGRLRSQNRSRVSAHTKPFPGGNWRRQQRPVRLPTETGSSQDPRSPNVRSNSRLLLG